MKSRSEMKRIETLKPGSLMEEIERLREENAAFIESGCGIDHEVFSDVCAERDDLFERLHQCEAKLNIATEALEVCGLTVWLSKYSGDIEWVKLNVQGAARAALERIQGATIRGEEGK